MMNLTNLSFLLICFLLSAWYFFFSAGGQLSRLIGMSCHISGRSHEQDRLSPFFSELLLTHNNNNNNNCFYSYDAMV